MTPRVMSRWISAAAAVAIASFAAGCEKNKSGEKPSASKGAEVRTQTPGDARKAAPKNKVIPGARAGSKTLLDPVDDEVLALLAKTKKLVADREYEKAIWHLNLALKKQPGLLEITFQRALVRAEAEDYNSALADLERVLYGDYPGYAAQTALLYQLRNLRKPPQKAKLDALLAAAKKEHVAAYGRAWFFLGTRARLRPMKRSQRKHPGLALAVDGTLYKERVLAGEQGVYGYIPQTGRYVSVARGAPTRAMGFTPRRGAVLGFIRAPDRKVMSYVWITDVGHFGSPMDEGYLTYMKAQAVVLDMTSLEVLGRHRGYESDVNAYYGGESCEPHMDQQASLSLRESGFWVFRFKTRKCAPEATMARRVRRYVASKYEPGKKPRKARRLSKKDRVVSSFMVQVCSKKTGLLHSANVDAKTPLKVTAVMDVPDASEASPNEPQKEDTKKKDKEDKSIEISYAFPCAGRAWPSPDGKRVAFVPGKDCTRDGKPMTGLWLQAAAPDTFKPPDAKTAPAGKAAARPARAKATWLSLGDVSGVHAVRWLKGEALMVQVGKRVLYLDPAAGKRQLLAGQESYLRAHAPFLDRCGVVRVK